MTYTLKLSLLEHGREKETFEIDVERFADARLAFEVTRDNGMKFIPGILREHEHG